MEIVNSFTVPASIGEAWDLFLDVDRIVVCMPGAELVEKLPNDAFLGKVSVKLGPIAMSFKGEARFVGVDEAARVVRLHAKGKELKGRGSAEATVTTRMREEEGGTSVEVTADLQLSGSVAQFGRGVIGDVSSKLVDQFAGCLAATLGGTEAERSLRWQQARLPCPDSS